MSFEEYIENSRDWEPTDIVKEAVEHADEGEALDIGCGALRDSLFLAKQGFEVEAVDQSDEVRKVYKEMDKTQKERINLEIKDITKKELEENKYQLINSQYTLHFLPKNKFENLLEKLKESLKPGGILSINLLGYQDEWKKPENNMNFHSTGEIKQMLSEMEVINYEEELKDGEKADGSSKYWHIHKIIAQKKLNNSQKH